MPAMWFCFTFVEDLMPVFDHGGYVMFVELIIMPGSCGVRSFLPWEIFMRADHEGRRLYPHYEWTDLYVPTCVLDDMKATLLHEFLHLYQRSKSGYKRPKRRPRDGSPQHLREERAIEEHVDRLLKLSPNIVDDIMRELIMHPHCSIIFPPDTQHPPFWTYYCGLVRELAEKARNGTFDRGEVRRLRVLLAAEMAGV